MNKIWTGCISLAPHHLSFDSIVEMEHEYDLKGSTMYRISGFFRWEQISRISQNLWQFAKNDGTKLSLLDRHAHKLINFVSHMR